MPEENHVDSHDCEPSVCADSALCDAPALAAGVQDELLAGARGALRHLPGELRQDRRAHLMLPTAAENARAQITGD